MSFPRYPQYKDSGVDWLGQVPAHWEVKPLKYNLRLLTEKTDKRQYPVALENIESWTGRFIPTETEFQGEGVEFVAGDILFGKLRPYLAKAYRAESSGEAVGDFHVMRPAEGIYGRFAQYQILSPEFIAIVDGSTFGSKMPRAGWEFVGGMPMTTPPLPEQRQIAGFLDQETGKIDALVAEQQRLLELLKEKRQAVISHAVTKGLNPKAPLKPSGIEWLGDVPEHWVLSRVKTLASLISKGTTPTTIGAEFTTEGIRFLKAENITETGVVGDPEFYISEEAHASLGRSSLQIGDVLVVIAGATTGKSAVLGESLVPANTNQAVSFIRPRTKGHSAYINLWLSTDLVRNFITLTSVQSAQPNLSMEDLGNIPIVIPPPDELAEIQRHLDVETARFDTLTAEAQRAIDLLQERRTALISAAVTGQIDVRHT